MPRREHLVSVVEALLRMSPQSLLEKGCEVFADGCIDQVALDGRFVLDEVRSALTISPVGERPGRHFMKDHRGCEALGGSVPAQASLLELKKRLEVRRGSRPYLVKRRVGQREVEQLETKLFALPVLSDSDVVRLEVAMCDSNRFEVPDKVEQVFTESLQQVKREPTFPLEPMCKCFGPCALHQKTRETLDPYSFRLSRHDPRVSNFWSD